MRRCALVNRACEPGGVPRRFGNVIAGVSTRPSGVSPAEAKWSPDGQLLAYGLDNVLHLARKDGTEVGRLATTAGEVGGLN